MSLSPHRPSLRHRAVGRVFLPLLVASVLVPSAASPVAAVTGSDPITTVAGNGLAGYAGDGGPATAARIYQPTGLAFDSAGNLYIAQYLSNVVRKVDRTSGLISTVAGTGVAGSSGDGGVATAATLNGPWDVAVDAAGNLYIAEFQGDRIRKVAPDGTISTIATPNGPMDLALDPTHQYLYWAAYWDHHVRRQDLTTGARVTMAGLTNPVGLAADPLGNVYVSATLQNRIYKITAPGVMAPFAGTGTDGFSGDGGPATAANLHWPRGLAADGLGNLYVSEYAASHRIRRVDSVGNINTILGDGAYVAPIGDGGPASAARVFSAEGLAIGPSGALFIADTGNNRVRRIGSPDTTPPVIDPHADVVAEAEGPDGATVAYALPLADDDVDGPVAVDCQPVSGSLFPLGDTTVTCTAQDAAGNEAESEFSVSVVDTTPPEVGDNSDIVAEATGPGGANVSYDTPTANDLVDGALAVSCSPASGSPFPLGDTTVECQVTDAAGNTGSSSFTITVEDTTAPSIAAHATVNANATSPSGADVVYVNPSASDLVDGFVPISCTPVSGSFFAIGDTTVECEAQDAAGNSAQTSFTVHVAGATEQLASLTGFVTGIGPGTSLQAKASLAESHFALGDTASACNILKALANEAKGQSGKKLTTAQANSIRAAANNIRAVLGC